MPDGRLMIAIKSYDDSFTEIKCWNCKVVVVYKKDKWNFIKCYNCGEKIETTLNNGEENSIIPCEICRTDLLVPASAWKIHCGRCDNDFEIAKIANQVKTESIHFFNDKM